MQLIRIYRATWSDSLLCAQTLSVHLPSSVTFCLVCCCLCFVCCHLRFLLLSHLSILFCYGLFCSFGVSLHHILFFCCCLCVSSGVSIISYSSVAVSVSCLLCLSPSPILLLLCLVWCVSLHHLSFCCCLCILSGVSLYMLLAYCPVAHPSLVQVYNFTPDVLTQLPGLGHCGEVGVCLFECVDRCLLYR